MRYLILGKNGQLGIEFQKVLEEANFKALSHKDCDVSNLNQVLSIFEEYKPDIVLNCSAYNFVDRAETDYWNSYRTNALGIRNLAYASKLYNSYLITYSTDYVFDGEKENGLYTEDNRPNPLNEYGKSKLTGEKWLIEEGIKRYLIFRTSWVYGNGKQNFVSKLLGWTKNNDYLKVSYDEISIPTSTKTMVEVTLKAIDRGLNGLYHLTNSGYASRYEWAKKILKIKGIDKFVYPVSRSTFNLPAKRPKFSAMSNERIKRELGIAIAPWDEELERSMR